jgi:hypothetical protein
MRERSECVSALASIQTQALAGVWWNRCTNQALGSVSKSGLPYSEKKLRENKDVQARHPLACHGKPALDSRPKRPSAEGVARLRTWIEGF